MVEQIKKDMIDAMKTGDTVKRDILRVLRGELQRDFVTEDSEVIRTIKKMISNIRDNNGEQDEIAILQEYLPKQMTHSEITDEVKKFIEDNDITELKEMGKVMEHFSKNFSGLFDGKEVSLTVKEQLK